MNHFLTLRTTYKNNKQFYLYCIDKNIVMTSSLKTPLTFGLIEETSTFDEIKKLSNYEVTMIQPANFNYYLNVN